MKKCRCLLSPALVFPFLMMMINITSEKSLLYSTCLDIAQNSPNVDYAFCTSTLQAVPTSSCTTVQGLAIISITLLENNITDTRCFINTLLRNRTTDPYLTQCLSDCLELFSDAIPSVKQAMIYYMKKRINDANIEISSIMDGATTCEDAFKERSGVVSPLTERNHYTFELSAMVLSLIHNKG